MAVGGHKKECKRLKAEKEAADAAVAAELSRLSLRRGAGGSTGAGASGSGSRRGSGSARVPLGASNAAAGGSSTTHRSGAGGGGGAFEVGELD